MLRGYIVDALLLFRDDYYRNWEYLRAYFAERSVHVFTVQAPPEKHIDIETNQHLTEQYYQQIVPPSGEGEVFRLVLHLDECHRRRFAELETMPRRTLDSIWWPFVQHAHFKSDSVHCTVLDV